jgi:predicted SAM-dependent methyltransferase
MLAVLEHIPKSKQKEFAIACYNKLKPGGRVIITVPSPKVDLILSGLKIIRLVDGMSLEEHYGYNPRDTETIFDKDMFKLVHHSRFQLGLNNVFVFEKAHRRSPANN